MARWKADKKKLEREKSVQATKQRRSFCEEQVGNMQRFEKIYGQQLLQRIEFIQCQLPFKFFLILYYHLALFLKYLYFRFYLFFI